MSDAHLPFNIGQIVETRSFEKGFRGAWFRCKIRDISRTKNGLFHKLEYLDFPDEKMHQTKVYQKLKLRSKDWRGKEHLMVRPEFPPVYRESEVPDVNDVLEVVVVNDSWNLGDLVDWLSDDCYWSGRITKVLGNEKFELELFPEPIGEGGCYVVSSNDLRPSLDYLPDNGWMVPFSKDGDKECCCARLIKPVKEGNVDSPTAETLEENELKIQPKAPASVNQKASPSQNSPPRTATKVKQGSNVSNSGTEGGGGGGGGEGEEEEEEEGQGEDDDDDDNTGGASKKLETSEESILLNTMMSSTTEAAVMDLEELVSRIKWLKGMLKCSSETAKSSWVFVEYRESTTPRMGRRAKKRKS